MSEVVITPPPPPAYKDRRSWLIVFGVVEILIGCVMLLMIAVVLFGMRHLPETPTPSPFVSPTAMMTIAAAFYGALAVLFVSIGIGSVQCRRWARLTMLIVGWIWLVQGVLGTVMMALMLPMIMDNARQQSRTPMPAEFDTIFRVVMLSVLGFFFVVLPLIFVLFYSGKNVKATCEARSAQLQQSLPTTAEKPLKPINAAVMITVIWFGIGTVSYLVMLFFFPVAPLAGFVLTGWSARAAIAAMLAISAWLTWNLYRQRALAWWVAVIWMIFGSLSAAVMQARGAVPEMYRAMGMGEAQITAFAPFATYGLLFGMVFGLAFLVFLVAIRKQFLEPSTLPAQV